MKKKLLSVLLVLVMVLGLLPAGALAAEQSLGSVFVTVENTTFTEPYTDFNGTVHEPAWTGVLKEIDHLEVPLQPDASMMTCILDALESKNAHYIGDKEQREEVNYLRSIDGLAEFDGGPQSGWMGTLNGWFTNEGFARYTVANGGLAAGDEIHVMYTQSGLGKDVGNEFDGRDTGLKSLTLPQGVDLNPAFSPDCTYYTLTLPEGVTELTLDAQAKNKACKVVTRVGDTIYRRPDSLNPIPVAFGTEITVTCGEGFRVKPTTYTICVGIGSQWPSFRGNVSNNGVTDRRTPRNELEVTLPMDEEISCGSGMGGLSQMILADDAILAVSENKLKKIDPQTGAEMNAVQLSGTMEHATTPPVYGEGKIFCQLDGGKVAAHNAGTLEELWVYEAPAGWGSLAKNPLTYTKGKVLVPFYGDLNKLSESGIACLDAKTGEELWTAKVPGGFFWAGCTVVGNYVIAAGENGNIYSFDIRTGAEKSHKNLTDSNIRSSVCYDNGNVYVTSKGSSTQNADAADDCRLHRVRISTTRGTLSIHKSVSCKQYGAEMTGTPVVYKGLAYVGAGQGFSAGGTHSILCVDLNEQRVLWSEPVPGYPQGSILLSTAYEEESGWIYLYFTTNAMPGGLYVIRARADGSAHGEPQMLHEPVSRQYNICSPIAGADGTIYYQNDSNCIFAVGREPVARVEALEEKIAALTAENPAGVAAALAEYAALEPLEQELVDGYGELLLMNETQVQKTLHLIAAIDKTITLASEKNIRKARQAYDALSAAEQKTISTYDKLLAAEAALSTCKVEDASQKIDAIGTVTLEAAPRVRAARAAFDDLTVQEQARVGQERTAILLDAEARLEGLEQSGSGAARVQAMIEALPETVTEADSDAVAAAREAYAALTGAEQARVSNYAKLRAAERALADLVNAAYVEALEGDAAYLLKQQIGTGSVGGEWSMLGLARAGKEIPKYFLDQYEAALLESLQKAYDSATGRLKDENGNQIATENERIALALTALGYDARNYHGMDLLKALEDTTWVSKQSVNNSIFALLALNARDGYAEETLIRWYVNDLLRRQGKNGGWYMSEDSETPDQDLTAMAIQALAPFYEEAEVRTAVEKAGTWLERNGSLGTSEGCVQMVTAWAALGQVHEDALVTLLDYCMEDGGFAHIGSGETDLMASEQALYGLAAYLRQQRGDNALYNMRDVELRPAENDKVSALRRQMEELEVKKADQRTYFTIRQIQTDFDKLTKDEQAQLARDKAAFDVKVEAFDALLKQARREADKALEEKFKALKEDDFTREQWKKVMDVYDETTLKLSRANYLEELEALLKKFDEDVKNIQKGDVTVTFRLIGDMKHAEGAHEKYVTWIPTQSYTVKSGSKVYDVFMAAVNAAGLSQRGADSNYVSTIRAPEVLGGFWLGEFDNGRNSGWMYTVNGVHPDVGLKACEVKNGDVIVWHYIDDYVVEENKNTWLEAEDISPEEYVKKQEEEPAEMHFRDVLETDWFYNDVKFAVENKLFNGTGKDTFSPNAPMTRSMLVTVLYRLEGEPEVSGPMDFDDVPGGTWFTDPVRWAAKNEIVKGVGEGRFAPDQNITREQMAAILYRYAEYKKYPMAEGRDLTGYADFKDISVYALKPLKWANAEGLINGRTATTLAPSGTATRAEVAAILHRFVENVTK